MKYKEIFTLWVKDELIKNGHELVKKRPNSKNPNYDVFIFENTTDFDNDLTKITKMKKSGA
ncbi:hypothetical protein LIT25_23940 [Bacillus sp. F19]|nr:hypothetical protein LIT25_23940 [Bacillus sp. F19]